MLENLKSKLSDKVVEQNVKLNYAVNKGLTPGANVFLKTYDTYRIVVGVIFVGFFLYFLLTANFLMGFVSFGFFHLHVFLNQIWWKLKSMETNDDR